MIKKPIELPPIISVELIQITDQTNIPFAPKAKKIIEKVKKKQEKLVSEQAPPKKVKKEKPDAIPLPDEKKEIVKKIDEKKQNPEKIEDEVKQVSEFEKDEMFDPNSIAALIDKSKEEQAETTKKVDKITQSQDKNMNLSVLTIPNFWSTFVLKAPGKASEKEGHPVPLSNLDVDAKSLAPQLAQ